MSDRPITLFWFRRDLRLNDVHGLYRALTEAGNVQPLFIFDTNILKKLEDRDDRRLSFLYDTITKLHRDLKQHGGSLLVKVGDPFLVFQALIKERKVTAVFANHDHEPYAILRDQQMQVLLEENGIELHSFKDQTVFDRDDVLKADGKPYTVYTPYMKRWRERLQKQGLETYPSELHLGELHQTAPFPLPSLAELGFERAVYAVPSLDPEVEVLQRYGERRDIPSVRGTTHLGVHLRFGTVSVRDMARKAQAHSAVWLNELIWREFFMQILWHFPHVAERSFRKKYDAIPWRNNEQQFQLWCEGKTGYPMVDAGMRELRETGFMHNRVRMVVASFLTKHLLIDWRWGEAWFARWLLDFDLASNNGNWQWAAGCGCDAAPYFRVFNPTLQVKRFDPELKYVRRWIPEFDSLEYPAPIVEHKAARLLAISEYKAALGG